MPVHRPAPVPPPSQWKIPGLASTQRQPIPVQLVGADPSGPNRMTWFLAGAAFGLVAYPFYAVFLGIPTPRKRLKRA